MQASPTGDRSLCATYHIIEGAYKPESENRPKSTIFKIAAAVQTPARLPDYCHKHSRRLELTSCTIINKPFTGGQDAQPLLPTRKLTLCGTGILPVLENAALR
ncbi:hypothetical protein [Microcoleus sp. A003_D6]|uniref:hypothetical protein n=1 Tax=Microcoleus sp. A003_D6 TaxID=3055266 RepID=UPI002FD3FA72